MECALHQCLDYVRVLGDQPERCHATLIILVFQSIQDQPEGPLFRAKYEDGDSEDLTYEELKALVTTSDVRAHLDVINKHDIRTWMAGKKTKSKKSTATKESAKKRSEAQVIDMTCTSSSQEEASCPTQPVKHATKHVEDAAAESDQQNAKVLPDQRKAESSPKEPLQQANTPSAKKDGAPTSVVAFFARAGGSEAVKKNANSEVWVDPRNVIDAYACYPPNAKV